MPVRYHLLPQAERKNQSGKDVFYRLASHVSPLSSTVYRLASNGFYADLSPRPLKNGERVDVRREIL